MSVLGLTGLGWEAQFREWRSDRFAPLENTGILRPSAQNDEQKQRRKQVPFGDDNQKSNDGSRSPSGMA
ncbi:MAG TPA: hypothetical protein VIX90_17295, partial [Edaphobacter sp.]